MKIVKYILLTIGILISAGVLAWFVFLRPEPPLISEEDRSQISLMPLPAKLELSGGSFPIQADWSVSLNHSNPRIEKAIDRFFERMKAKTGFGKSSQSGETIVIEVTQKESKLYPEFGEDESYKLAITKEQIHLSAPTEFGIIQGLETLNQLQEQQDGKWLIKTMEIEDQPRFPWRGLMIDVARHWIPKEVILRNLDAMAAVKMNVLHLHLSDFQGFRVESKKFPKLHENGSSGNYFTQEEIREIISYAADLGIRIVPEFDVPGHATGILAAYPELATGLGPESPSSDVMPDEHVMDPTKEETYQFLEGLVEEMGALFPDRYFHIGGDEVNPTRWRESPSIQNFMKEKPISDHKGLQAYFNTRLFAILEKQGKRMSGWDEIINPELPAQGITIQAWRSTKSLWDAARQGYQSILSSGYYLDHKLSAKSHYETDPLVIPGAVEIEIDSTQWTSYDMEIAVDEALLEGELYLFGEGENLRGILSFMGNPMGFETAQVEGKTLSFSCEIPMGTFKNTYTFDGDSLTGKSSLALFTFDVHGKKTGGSDFPEGKPLPKFDKIEPLTPEQEKNIIGGEAAMWTEMANARTLESRIWPRAAAIAEKLWSPQSLSNEVSDMYRRIQNMDEHLESLGIQHRKSSTEILSQITQMPFLQPLSDLTSILQEDILFNRMQLYPEGLKTDNPLDRVVDAARPESLIGYRFNQEVADYLASPTETKKANLVAQLQTWIKLNSMLAPAYAENPKIAEVAPHALNLEKLGNSALQKLQNEKISLSDEELKMMLSESLNGFGGTILAVHEGLQKLIMEK